MWRSAEGFVRSHWVNLLALWLALWLAIFGAGAYYTRLNYLEAMEANRHSAENNRILSGRNFNRLYAEHERHHAEHAEILRKCGR